MIVSQVVRGQEEGNWELLKAHDAGTLATTPEQVVAAITAAFDHGADQWKRWRRGLEHLARPTAASDIARQILSETAAEGGPTTLSPAAPTASSVACPPDRTTHRILTG
jgi:processive 1,2-diacylglycerol beta-glucosyltransferase